MENKPDFIEWIKSKEGLDCLQWPISEPKYLQNRLFWAFDAGRTHVWDQYLKQKSENERLLSALKEAVGHVYDKEAFKRFKQLINEIEKQPS